MSTLLQRQFWLALAAICVAAIVAAVPVLMSGVLARGFEIAKQSVAEPLAVLACGAALLGARRNWFTQRDAATKIAAGSLAVFLLLAVVSTVLSENPEVAIFGGYYRREGLLEWGVYAVFFVAVLVCASAARWTESVLDVLLLASVIPAAYAVQQRFGLDFYVVASGELARPGATLGSPLFLAAYLGILLPLTAVRCWQMRGDARRLVLWFAVAILQAVALLLTQTRGPLLALIAGFLLLACMAAGYARARRFFFFSAAGLTLLVVALLAINTLDGARQWAQDVPVARRLVFDLGRGAGDQTQRASASAAARLAIWGAGADTFQDAPLANKLLGYGPESAYLHYFAYIPASVMQLIGHDAYFTYDRMHADALDIGLNFGVLAWLAYCLFFCAVMYAAASALFGFAARGPPLIFLGCTLSCAGLFAAAAVCAGLPSAAAPAFGIGAGIGWFVFMAGSAYRALQHGVARSGAPGKWTLLAGLTAALLVFWLDAQINIPVLTTRLISFALAALMLVTAGELRRDAAIDETGLIAASGVRRWGIAFTLVAFCASALPLTAADVITGAGVPLHWPLRFAPLFVFMMAAALMAWGYTRREGGGANWRSGLAIALGLPTLYAVIHVAITATRDLVSDAALVQSISIAAYAGPACIFAMCAAFALRAGRRREKFAQPLPAAARWSICAIVAAVALIVMHDLRTTRADAAATLATQTFTKLPQLGRQLGEDAIRLLPYERYYHRQLALDLLARAVADLRALAASPAQLSRARLDEVLNNLAAAESAARMAVLRFPRDPWVIVTLANVLQIEALRVLRPIDPAGGARASFEAQQLFEQAHGLFPNQPLFLRNWAQLLADDGDAAGAYKLLDLMEKQIPADPEPYLAQLAVAQQMSDKSMGLAITERARRALEPKAFRQLLNVANAQQK